jgi:transcriptional regulator with GAF, ATPase, and Fis domain
MALPLKIGNRVIGVLDVQSKLADAFNQEDLETLQILADQLVVALENARLLSESKQTLRELEEQYSKQIQKGWQETISARRIGYMIGPLAPTLKEKLKCYSAISGIRVLHTRNFRLSSCETSVLALSIAPPCRAR